MTKYLGNIVGTPISGAAFARVPHFNKSGIHYILWADVATIAAGGAIGDQVSLGSFKSNAQFAMGSALYWTALGAGVTANIGDVNYPAGLGAAVSMAAAGSGMLQSAVPVANYFQPLWKLLGYAADPGGTIELLATFAGAAPAAGSLAWAITGQDH